MATPSMCSCGQSAEWHDANVREDGSTPLPSQDATAEADIQSAIEFLIRLYRQGRMTTTELAEIIEKIVQGETK